MSKTIKITYHGNSVTVALVERPLLANESEYSNSVLSPKARKFQLTAARRRLEAISNHHCRPQQFQLTAARRRLGGLLHARRCGKSFNSQPPEGGWFANL